MRETATCMNENNVALPRWRGERCTSARGSALFYEWTNGNARGCVSRRRWVLDAKQSIRYKCADVPRKDLTLCWWSKRRCGVAVTNPRRYYVRMQTLPVQWRALSLKSLISSEACSPISMMPSHQSCLETNWSSRNSLTDIEIWARIWKDKILKLC